MRGSRWAARRLLAANSAAIGKKSNAADRPSRAITDRSGLCVASSRSSRKKTRSERFSHQKSESLTVHLNVLAPNSASGRDSDAPGAASPTPAIANAAPASALSALAAVCAVARLHRTSADATTLGHQMGLSTSDKLRSADLMRAVKQLGLNTNLSRRSVLRAWHGCRRWRSA